MLLRAFLEEHGHFAVDERSSEGKHENDRQREADKNLIPQVVICPQLIEPYSRLLTGNPASLMNARNNVMDSRRSVKQCQMPQNPILLVFITSARDAAKRGGFARIKREHDSARWG